MDTTRPYEELFPSKSPGRVKWVLAAIAVIAVLLAAGWLLGNVQGDGTQTAQTTSVRPVTALNDDNGEAPQANNSKAQFLSIEILTRLSTYNAKSTATITNLLNNASVGWDYTGHDGNETIWTQNTRTSMKDGTGMLTYFNREGIWEYLFFDEHHFLTLSNTIVGDCNLVSEQNDGATITKTYKSSAFVFQTCVTQFRNENRPYGYKVLVLPVQQQTGNYSGPTDQNSRYNNPTNAETNNTGYHLKVEVDKRYWTMYNHINV